MSEPRLAVIMPTTGRETIRGALDSCRRAGIRPTDTLFVMVDGAEHETMVARAVWEADLPCRTVTAFYEPPRGGVGGPLRNDALDSLEASGAAEWVLYLDDDDELADGALELVRGIVAEDPEHLHIFRMDSKIHGLLWREAHLGVGNVGGPMFVAPVDPERTGRWDGERCQDQRFMVETSARHDMRVRFHEDIIYLVRPHEWREEQEVIMYETMGPPIKEAVFAFVTGHDRPTPCPAGARYVRRHPDGSIMEAAGEDDTLEACQARYTKAQESKAAKAAPKSEAKTKDAPAVPAERT